MIASIDFWHALVKQTYPDVSIEDVPKYLDDVALTVIDADNECGYLIVKVNSLGIPDDH